MNNTNAAALHFNNQMFVHIYSKNVALNSLMNFISIKVHAEQFFSRLRSLKTYPRSTLGQQRVSNIASINIEREYDNSVVNNAVDRTIDIFSHRNGRGSYFF